MMCQDADQVHWLSEKGVRDGGGAQGVNEKQYTWRQTANRALDSDVLILTLLSCSVSKNTLGTRR